jgi:tetratricopeptide (TPR) repeat protein
LNLADVKTCPNSARTNIGATKAFLSMANAATSTELKKQNYSKAVYYGTRALEIFPSNVTTKNDLDYAYLGMLDCFTSTDLFIADLKMIFKEEELNPLKVYLSTLLYRQGNGFNEQDRWDEAIRCYQKSVELNSENIVSWYNLGGTYYLKNDTLSAIDAWNNVKRLDPNYAFNKQEFFK